MLVFFCFIFFTLGAANTVRGPKCDLVPSCKTNEHYVEDSSSCPKTCLNYRQADVSGACQPFTGCECDEGYVRLNDDGTGACVLTSECDVINCNGDSNATYKECPWACPATCEKPDAISVCKRLCRRSGCECKPGYILSENGGSCIRPNDCPGGDPCRGNQTFVACKAGCPTNYCPADDSRAIVACSPPYPCPPGCVCKSNHLRLSTKDTRCFKTQECPKVNCTRPNEEWNTCPSNCLAERCSDIGKNKSDCDRPYSYCRPQCVCKEGFYRNQSDICVSAGQCSCLENEQYVENSTVYQKTCGNRLVSGLTETTEPFTGCICAEGFVRPYDNATGPCLPVSECAPIPKDCGYNEEPSSCKVICPPQSCAIAYTDYLCLNQQCEPGCNCIKDHLRNSSEICIFNEDCLPPQPIEPVCGANEEPTDCEESWPAGTCDSVYNNFLKTIPNTDTLCTPGCKCVDNYLRDIFGVCIPREECPQAIEPECGLNEELSDCEEFWPFGTCDSLYDDDSETKQIAEELCSQGCNCIDGYLRDSLGICIPQEGCPQSWPENEHYVQNSSECQRTCGNRLIRYEEECSSYTGYVCDDGFVRMYDNATGPCIPVTDCAPIPDECGYNEEPSSCKFICPPQVCENSYTEYACPDRQCEPGCNCKENHLRNSSQICIFNEDCPPPQPIEPVCGANEEPTDCEEFWPYGSCDSVYEDDADTTLTAESLCVPGCKCIDNYLRDSLGICIPRDECPQTWPENEHYVENSTECQKTCGNRLVRNAGECSPYTGYVCDDGFVRRYDNATGPCIPVINCAPIPQTCGYNEEPTSCKVICPPQSCRIAYTEYLCLEQQCEPGCNCIENHLRNSSDICIFNNDCPPPEPIEPECGPNEEPTDCEEFWPNGTCESLYEDDLDLLPCGESSCISGCKCIDNYLRDSIGICIPKEECPQSWPENEHYVVNSTECQRTCGNRLLRNAEECPPYSGYVCDDGYVRAYDNATGPCIPVTDCAPIPTKCGLNEEPTSCKITCPPESCDVGFINYLCAERRCSPGCNCIKNHLRNSSQICIANSNCPPRRPLIFLPECGPNEISIVCEEQHPPDTCESLYTNKKRGNVRFISDDCTPSCRCSDNYRRNNIGICIPMEECSEFVLDNSHYVSNSTDRQKTCGNRLVSGTPEPSEPFTGYVCDDGYVRLYDNATGPCILESDCEPIPTNCGLNEEPTSCAAFCPPQSCEISYTSYACDKRECKPGCNCIENYLRNSSGICILNDNCPPQQQNDSCDGDRNATYKACPLACPPTCDSPNAMSNCSKPCPDFRCECQPGYILSSIDGQCILPEDCPGGNPCGRNKTFVYCKVGCPSDYCPSDDSLAVVACSPPYPCLPGCSCIGNNLLENTNDDTGYDEKRCILSSDCSPVNCTRPNEEWNSCPGLDFPEKCTDIGKEPTDRNGSYSYCAPRCVCKKGFYRNESEICVPAEECSKFDYIFFWNRHAFENNVKL